MNDFNSTNNSTFLPRGFREFFRSRFNEAFELIIIIFTTSIIISIWGFNPNDPIYYFKSSTKGTLNILGNYGSNLSGVLLHLFGVGSAFFCLFGYLWGFKFLRNEQISKKKLRLTLLLPSIILLSIFLSLFPLQTIYLPEGAGGAIGHLLSSLIPNLNDGWAFGYLTGGNWPLIVSTLLISIPIYLWSCTASTKEVVSLKSIISPLLYAAGYLTRLVLKPVTRKRDINTTKQSRRIEPTIASKRKNVNNIRTLNRKKPRQTSLNLGTSDGYNLPSVE